jgi:transposase-like protein
MGGRRVPASKQTGERIDELLAQGSEGDVRSELIRLGVRRIVEEALEAEVEDRLGRGYYGRGDEESRGHRNGYRRRRLKSAEGAIEYGVPQVRGLAEGYRSEIGQRLAGRTEELERLAVEMYARGLSTRDIEATFSDEEGRSLLSRTAVSEVTEKLWEEYEAFATRDLSEHELLYLFVDGVAERLRPGLAREAVLCAWGIDVEGQKVLLALSPGTKEDTESCKAFFQDMRRRGLGDPLLCATDGAPGLIRAVEECFPRSRRQRCLAHRMRNLQSKVPDHLWPEVRVRAKAAYEAPSPQMAEALRDDFVEQYEKELPSATKCFLDDFDACIAHLSFPVAHRKVIRTTNLLERLFQEERRRTKIIPNAFGERPVLKLMYAALIRTSESWRGIRVTAFETKQCEVIRQEIDTEHGRRHASPVKKSRKKSEGGSATRVSSSSRT